MIKPSHDSKRMHLWTGGGVDVSERAREVDAFYRGDETMRSLRRDVS